MAEACWFITITGALDAAGNSKTLYFSDGEYGVASNLPFLKRLFTPALVTVSPNDGGTLKIFATASVGEVALDNTDGKLDYLAGYAIDGRAFNQSYFNGSSVVSYFDGTCSGMRESDGKIYISLRTLKDTLDTDHPQAVYTGTNVLPDGVEGVADDIKGNVKPRCYGKNINQAGVLVNTAKLIYQFSDRASTVMDAVYVPGTLTKAAGSDYSSIADMIANAPAAGYWKAYRGYVRLGSAPGNAVTADSHDSSNLAGDVFKSICDERSIATDAASITALNSIGEVGLMVDATRSTSDMLNELIAGLFSYYYFIGSTIYVKRLALAAIPAFDLYDTNEYRQIEKLERKGTGIGEGGLPYSGIKMQCDKVLTVQANLGGTAIPADRLARISQQWRKAEATNSACVTRHPLAKTLNVDSCIRTVASANTLINSVLPLLSNRCDWVSITAHYQQLPVVAIGTGFTLYSDQLGYNAGKLLTIIDYELDAANNVITLGAIG